MLVWLPDGIM